MQTVIGRWRISGSADWKSTDGRLYFQRVSHLHAKPEWVLLTDLINDRALLAASGMPRRSSPGRGLKQMTQEAASVLGCSTSLVREHSYDLYLDDQSTGWRVCRTWNRWSIQVRNTLGLGSRRLWPYMDDSLQKQLLNGDFLTRKGLLEAIEAVADEREATRADGRPWYEPDAATAVTERAIHKLHQQSLTQGQTVSDEELQRYLGGPLVLSGDRG